MLSMPLVYLEYVINQAAITELLCENKEQVEMHCKGKCHLKKQLDKANDSTESNTERNSAKILSVEFVDERAHAEGVYLAFASEKKYYYTITPPLTAGTRGEVFEPPSSVPA